MRGHALSGLAPSDQFVVYETKYWQVNQRVDTTLPGYLMVGAKDPIALELANLPAGALLELGCVLRTVTAALQTSFKPEHIHVCCFGHSPGHTVHFHVIPVYEWMKQAYRRMARKDEAVQYPNFTDGASLALFVSEEFTRRRAPCEIPGPRIEHVIQALRDALSREAAQQAASADR
jgi:diadenosine tetraphosphate (Ap4A) HIT family hydrolase